MDLDKFGCFAAKGDHRAGTSLSLQFPARLSAQRDSYEGFHTRPLGWLAARKKFDRVAQPLVTAAEGNYLAETIVRLDKFPIGALTAQLGSIGAPPKATEFSSRETGRKSWRNHLFFHSPSCAA